MTLTNVMTISTFSRLINFNRLKFFDDKSKNIFKLSLILKSYVISLSAKSMTNCFTLLLFVCKYDNVFFQSSFECAIVWKRNVISIVWFVRFDWSSICACQTMKINIIMNNFFAMTFQKSNMNFAFLSFIIVINMLQSWFTKSMTKTFVQTVVFQIFLSTINKIRLLNVQINVNNALKSFLIIDNIIIQFMNIVWNDLTNVINDVSFS